MAWSSCGALPCDADAHPISTPPHPALRARSTASVRGTLTHTAPCIRRPLAPTADQDRPPDLLPATPPTPHAPRVGMHIPRLLSAPPHLKHAPPHAPTARPSVARRRSRRGRGRPRARLPPWCSVALCCAGTPRSVRGYGGRKPRTPTWRTSEGTTSRRTLTRSCSASARPQRSAPTSPPSACCMRVLHAFAAARLRIVVKSIEHPR